MAKKSLFICNSRTTGPHINCQTHIYTHIVYIVYGQCNGAKDNGAQHIEMNANRCQDERHPRAININFNMTKNIFAICHLPMKKNAGNTIRITHTHTLGVSFNTSSKKTKYRKTKSHISILHIYQLNNSYIVAQNVECNKS